MINDIDRLLVASAADNSLIIGRWIVALLAIVVIELGVIAWKM